MRKSLVTLIAAAPLTVALLTGCNTGQPSTGPGAGAPATVEEVSDGAQRWSEQRRQDRATRIPSGGVQEWAEQRRAERKQHVEP